ncbi:hypothetical protein [Nitrogeniibacter aestuarii]|uniref:hypothetical protein n=1 Tax=Nitrogeniibacter aestuarii TaxID=2815343 RepID=UPI001E54C662|nr:hypothetical protein [Nitrogeniibacter aestuarii]
MVQTNEQLLLALDCEEPYLIHQPELPGFISILVQGKDGRKRQQPHRLEALPNVLERLTPDLDTWISQAQFRKPNRRAVNVWRMPVAFVDIDTYKIPALQGLSVSMLLARLLMTCDDAGVPEPSLVVWSGRGLQAKWVFESPVPSRALPRWQALQNELCRRLAPIGADLMARDVSRVLRLVDTVNTKSGERVRLVHQASVPTMGGIRRGQNIVYAFDALFDELMPVTRGELDALRVERDENAVRHELERSARVSQGGRLTLLHGGKANLKGGIENLRPFVPSQLAWDRVGDIRKLAELRGWGNGAPAGERNLPLFLCACFLAQALIVPKLEFELAALARELAPTWTRAQVGSCVSAVFERAKAAARGETVTFGGIQVDPRYRWKNATLIELLQIRPEEERQLATIISKTESRRRSAERSRAQREANGAQNRAEWRASHSAKRLQAVKMREEGATWQTIAEVCGYPSKDAARMAYRSGGG